MKTAFIGHRKILAKDICERLMIAIKNEIDRGCKTFTMGTHGEFDNYALNICKQLRNTYKDLDIEVVITSLNTIKKTNKNNINNYSDVKTVMYDIKDIHYKQQITISNRYMLDNCNSLICYVNTSEQKSGAKTALQYAEKKGLKIINLYKVEDAQLYEMSN